MHKEEDLCNDREALSSHMIYSILLSFYAISIDVVVFSSSRSKFYSCCIKTSIITASDPTSITS
jgi:hypothetical protein